MKKARLKMTCGKCKHLYDFPYIGCGLKCEFETFYLDKEKTVFDCRPKYAYECKKAREKYEHLTYKGGRL